MALGLLLPVLCPAANWVRFSTPAFEVYSDAGERPARDTLVWFEQYRFLLGQMVGAKDLKTDPPIRIVVYKSKPPGPPALMAGRERWFIPMREKTTPPPALLRDLTDLYLESIERMPAELERGLRDLLSMVRIETTKVTLGLPPAQPNKDWALVQMMVVNPDYAGRLRVMMYNLRQGIDEDASFRNAFGKTAAEVRKQAEAYFASGNFQTAEISGRPISPLDFHVEEADPPVLEPSTPEQALKLRYRLAEPHFEAAQRATDVAVKIKELQAATANAPRRDDYWQALARAYLEQKNFPAAGKAWRSAEQAAVDDAQRQKIRQARAAIEQQRLDYEAAEKKRIADEKEREIARLKAEALNEVRQLEARANRGESPPKPDEKVVPWWDGPQAGGKASGVLKQVDCLRGVARLVIETDDRKIVRLAVRNPGQVAIGGGGEQTLGCGPQKNRRIRVEYFPKPDPKLATAGEVASIEFQ